MKNAWLPILICVFGCQTTPPEDESNHQPPADERELSIKDSIIPGFQTILDSADVSGSVLVYDPVKRTYYSNDFDWSNTGHLPASTFKIVNSIIGLETGVVEDDSTFFPWDGKKRRLKLWEQDMIFSEAFSKSCLPCYQEIARKIGPERMAQYLDTLDYGHMTFDSSSVDVFWVLGESTISQMEQIDFLERFNEKQLPISDRTYGLMQKIMFIEQTDSYTLKGKTGWSIREGHNIGWFVGFVEAKDQVYYFATKVEPEVAFDMRLFPIIRSQITMKALQDLSII